MKLKKLGGSSKFLKSKIPNCPECGNELGVYLYPRPAFHYGTKEETGKFPCDHPDFVCYGCRAIYMIIKDEK